MSEGLPGGFDSTRTSSLGMRLIQDLAEQPGGTAEIGGEQGTRFTLRFKRQDSPAFF